MGQLLDHIPELLVVLNGQRQVVHANRKLLDMLGMDDEDMALGRRLGELLSCQHAGETPGGCGTSEHCRECGAVLAILASQEGKEDVRECSLMVRQPDGGLTALDLQIWASPLEIMGERYSFLAVNDLADHKRRLVLEKVFLHDLLNTVGGLVGLTNLLQEAAPNEVDCLKESIVKAAKQLMQEISAQRDLLAAENKELAVQPETFVVGDFLRDQADLVGGYPLARGRRIVLDLPQAEVNLLSDPTLASRVVSNLLKNALEACSPGDTVTLGLQRLPQGGVEIWTTNPGVMPLPVRRQVFQRSFSTKGPGRGLGTYSVKLLTECYLQGEVGFHSGDPAGTTFWVRLPQLPEQPTD